MAGRSEPSPLPSLRRRPPLPVVPGGSPATAFLDLARTVALDLAEFLAGDGIVLHGRQLVVVGELETALGLALYERPSLVLLVDDEPADPQSLLSAARRAGVADELPGSLVVLPWAEAAASQPCADLLVLDGLHLRTDDLSTVLLTVLPWLAPDGLVLLRADPLWTSAQGAGLGRWGLPDFAHRLSTREQLVGLLAERLGDDEDPDAQDLAAALGTLPESSPDDLLEQLRAVGLVLRKVAVRAEGVHVPPALQHRPLSELITAGLLVLAQPADG